MARVMFLFPTNDDGSPTGAAELLVDIAGDGAHTPIVVPDLTVEDARETWSDTGDRLRVADDNSDPEGDA